MARTLLTGGRNSAVTLGNFGVPFQSMTTNPGTEAVRQIPLRVSAGVFTGFAATVDANGTGRSIQFRKNGANGNVVVQPTDSTAGNYTDFVHGDRLAIGDNFCLQMVGVAPAFIPFVFNGQFVADNGTVGIYGQANLASANGFPFCAIGGSWQPTEVVEQSIVRAPATYSNLVCSVGTSAANSVTIVSRKNGANGNLTVTIGSGLTGIFEDTTHSDTVVSGDSFNYTITTGLGAYPSFAWAITANHTTALSEVVLGTFNPSFNASAQYKPLGGAFLTTTESSTQSKLGCSGVFSRLRCYVVNNLFTGTLTYRLRKNTANANQVLTIGAGVTGLFEDTTNTDSFDPNDLLNLVVTGGTSGSCGINWSLMSFTPYENSLWIRNRKYLRK